MPGGWGMVKVLVTPLPPFQTLLFCYLNVSLDGMG